MVVLMTQDFAGGNRVIAEAVSNDMDVRENPPTGLIAHVLTDIPGGIRAVDIWEMPVHGLFHPAGPTSCCCLPSHP
jgi:hypothetical protein